MLRKTEVGLWREVPEGDSVRCDLGIGFESRVTAGERDLVNDVRPFNLPAPLLAESQDDTIFCCVLSLRFESLPLKSS